MCNISLLTFFPIAKQNKSTKNNEYHSCYWDFHAIHQFHSSKLFSCLGMIYCSLKKKKLNKYIIHILVVLFILENWAIGLYFNFSKTRFSYKQIILTEKNVFASIWTICYEIWLNVRQSLIKYVTKNQQGGVLNRSSFHVL